MNIKYTSILAVEGFGAQSLGSFESVTRLAELANDI